MMPTKFVGGFGRGLRGCHRFCVWCGSLEVYSICHLWSARKERKNIVFKESLIAVEEL